MRKHWIAGLMLVGLVSLLGGCQDESRYGRVQVYLTDGPVDAETVQAIVLSINRIELKGPEGWQTVAELDTPLVLNILDYQNGDSYFVTEESLPAGTYTEVRLVLNAPDSAGPHHNPGCYIEFTDSTQVNLFVPSGAQSGYKVKGSFTIPPDGMVAVTLDFDARKSIVQAGASGQYHLKPVVRLIANADASVIEGNFADHALYEKVVVYAYEAGTFDPSEAAEPAAGEVRFSNALNSTAVAETGDFTLAFMTPGEYDLILAAHDETGGFVELIGKYENVTMTPGARVELNLTLLVLVVL